MSYLVFARKWRPLTFDDVVGQDHITQTLRMAIEKDRVAHGYIFTGTRGVGKTTCARILARALNCVNGPTPTPCGTCDSCKSIIGGSSFDVMEIDGASNRGVEDVRELRDNVTYSSMGGRFRVIIIDEVHMLTREAFNALLKTLEEPPPRVIFIFATTEPQKIPATIHSRCQRYDFRRISTEQIAGQLEKICTADSIRYTREGLILIARKADGSMRDSLSLLDQVNSYGKDVIGEAEVRAVLGIVDIDVYFGILDAVRDRNSAPLLEAVQNVLFHGLDLHEFTVGLEEHLRNLLFARIENGLRNRASDFSPETLAMITEQAGQFSDEMLLRMAEVVRKAEYELKWSSYPRFLVESMLMRLARLEDTTSLEKVIEMLGGDDLTEKKKDLISPPAPPVVPADAVPAEAPEPPLPSAPASVVTVREPETSGLSGTSPEYSDAMIPADSPEGEEGFIEESETPTSRDLSRDWPVFLEQLMDDRPHLGSFLSHAAVASVQQHAVDLRYAQMFKFQFAEVTRKQNRDIIEEKLAEFARRPIQIHITLETEGDPQDLPNYIKSVADTGASIVDDMKNEPIIQAVLDAFDGEVLP